MHTRLIPTNLAKHLVRSTLLAVVALCAMLAAGLGTASAQQGSRVIVNGGMEFGVAAGANQILDADFGFGATFDNGVAATNPWFTTHPTTAGLCATTIGDCHPIEVWGNNFNPGGTGAVPAQGGTNFIELNANTNSMVYQNVCVASGETIGFSYFHRKRNPGGTNTNPDVARMIIRNQTGGQEGTILSTSSTTSTTTWTPRTGSTSYTGTSGVMRLGFEAVSTASGNITLGNLLDTISITLNPLADLAGSTSAAAPEGSALGTVFIRLNGTTSGATTIALQRTAPTTGTAAIDTDFSITSTGGITVSHTAGTDIWLVTIPAGTAFDGGVAPGSGANNPADGVTLNVAALTDAVLEVQEGFRLQILAAGSNGSTTNWLSADPACANDRVQQTNDFIIQAQTDLSINKTNTPASGTADQTGDTVTAGPTTYTITVTNNGPGAVTGPVVRDTPTAGLTCPGGNVVSCAPAAACAGPYSVSGLTGAGGITLGTLASNGAATLTFSCTVQ